MHLDIDTVLATLEVIDPTIIDRLRGRLLPQALSVTEVSKILSISKSTLYERVRNGEILSIKLNGRVRIPGEWVWDLFDTSQNVRHGTQDATQGATTIPTPSRTTSNRNGGAPRDHGTPISKIGKRRKSNNQNAIYSTVDYRATIDEATEKVD